jgi:hypothetical protein
MPTDEDKKKAEKRLPSKSTVTGFFAATALFVGAVIGRPLDQSWIEPLVGAYVTVAPIVLGWFIHRTSKEDE